MCHARAYADFTAENAPLLQKRIVAMTTFITDVRMGAYPSRRYLVDSDAEVVLQFRDWLAT